jgi:hypothetical protein
MLPRVRELEQKFGDVLVAIGVHAGKYTAERRTENIAEACRRLGVHHPVVNDRQYRVWRSYAVQAWPTLAFVDPNGYLVASQAGELPLPPLEELVEAMIQRYGGEIRREPFALARPPTNPDTGPLRFPGKLLAAEGRLYISDTGHNQILELLLTRNGGDDPAGNGGQISGGNDRTGDAAEPHARVTRRLGSGEAGFEDGAAGSAAFREPQGLALAEGALFVADRGNHALRRIELKSGRVETIAGTGELGGRILPGPARETALRSPWDLWHREGTLYIAMAGSHQIWRMDLRTGELRVHAGSGAEAIDDGPLARATLAQPSGLASDGERLYFADAESSSIRWADFDEGGRVGTIVGTGLFDFGDRDGQGEDVRLQHPLAVAWHEGSLIVADSYNGKLKRVDPRAHTAMAWPKGHGGIALGSHETGAQHEPADERGEPAPEAPLSEPGGLSIGGAFLCVADTGNHRIVRVPLAGGRFEALKLPVTPG